MAEKKEKITSSPLQEINGEKYSFTFSKEKKGRGKLIGINKMGANGTVNTPVDPSGAEWNTVTSSSGAMTAYNQQINERSWNSQEDRVIIADKDTLDTRFNQETKKFANQAALAEELNEERNISVATDAQREFSPQYADYKESRGQKFSANFYTYPLDIDPLQDHMKISKYKYKRPSVQGSRGATSTEKTRSYIPKGKEWSGSTQGGNDARAKEHNKKATVTTKYNVNKPGDSMLGSILDGTVILPMPKVVDTNGAEWGESELNILGLAAASLAGKFIGGGDKNDPEFKAAKKIAERLKKNPDRTSGFGDVKNAIVAATAAEASVRATGQTITQDELLARAQGRVLNPNAELLFQGPVLRDFNFDFLMIARSRQEGAQIRSIIRWFKLGMAPQFNNSTFLNTPDIFTLEYKRGQGPMDQLNTVNRFNPGGLALRTIAVDYAPNGYWSAYQDSQPVAVKMSLNFAELRPIYKGDHERLPEGSVGY